MFFIVAKTVGIFLEPLNLLAFLVVGAAGFQLIGLNRGARRLVTLAAVGFLAVALLPVDATLRQPLETRFPPLQPFPPRVDGIILLGGAENPTLSAYYAEPVLRGPSETLGVFLSLARRYPKAQLVFTGGSGDPLQQTVSEAVTVKLYLRQQGFDADRVTYETRARNTQENAQFSRELVHPRTGQVWLLVAAAVAMPRAVGVFRTQDWPVVPVPCGWRWMPNRQWQPERGLAGDFSRLDETLHEWIGLFAYYVTGRTPTLLPARDP